MKKFVDSDIYRFMDKGGKITANIHKIFSGNSTSIKVLNQSLGESITSLLRIPAYKKPSTINMVNAVKSGEIILLSLGLDSGIPRFIPFIKFKQNGVWKVAINMTSYVNEIGDKDTGNTLYVLKNDDKSVLYTLLMSAYVSLHLLTDTYAPSSETLYSASSIWAAMFCNVLNRKIGLSQNIERYKAFYFFSMKFFMSYFLDISPVLSEQVAMRYIGTKNQTTLNMEEAINRLNINWLDGVSSFCNMLFNNEVTNIRGVKINNIADEMNFSFFINEYTKSYKWEAIMSLASFQYFVFAIMSVIEKCRIVNDAAITSIFKNNSKDSKLIPQMINSVLKDI